MSDPDIPLQQLVSLLSSKDISSLKQGCELAEALCTKEETFRELLKHLGSLKKGSYLHIWSLGILSQWEPSLIENMTELAFCEKVFSVGNCVFFWR